MKPDIDHPIQIIFQIQARIADLHPFLEKVFPIAIAEEGRFFIFDKAPLEPRYLLVKTAPTPMPIPQGVRAAFPLEAYDNQIVCVVTEDVFDTLDGYATIFHEFIHCQQFEHGETSLKETLKIYHQAQAKNDFMWEITYPFPYQTPQFFTPYAAFLEAADGEELEEILRFREKLAHGLDREDLEYLVWQEWKEGFARWIENRIRSRLGIEENHAGKEQPFSRVSLYEGGSRWIDFLVKYNKINPENIVDLFHKMIKLKG